jgi:hypothetical protein
MAAGETVARARTGDLLQIDSCERVYLECQRGACMQFVTNRAPQIR